MMTPPMHAPQQAANDQREKNHKPRDPHAASVN